MVKNRFSNSYILNPIALCLIAILAIGCGTTSDERIAILKTGIDKATTLSAEADKYIAVLDSQLLQADQILATAQIDEGTTAKVREVIVKIQEEKARVAAQKLLVDQSIADWGKQIAAITADGSANIGTELQIIGTGMTSAAPAVPGPVGGYMALVGALLAAVGAGVGKVYQSRKDSAAINALPEVVKGVDDILSQMLATTQAQEQAKAILMLRQSSETQALVGTIKNQ